MFGNLEVDVADRLARLGMQVHIRFPRGAIALFDVALKASCHDIFPAIAAAPRTGDDVVDSEVMPAFTAVLTSVAIAMKDVPTREAYLFVRNLYVCSQADHRRQGKLRIHQLAVMLNLLRLAL